MSFSLLHIPELFLWAAGFGLSAEMAAANQVCMMLSQQLMISVKRRCCWVFHMSLSLWAPPVKIHQTEEETHPSTADSYNQQVTSENEHVPRMVFGSCHREELASIVLQWRWGTNKLLPVAAQTSSCHTHLWSYLRTVVLMNNRKRWHTCQRGHEYVATPIIYAKNYTNVNILHYSDYS